MQSKISPQKACLVLAIAVGLVAASFSFGATNVSAHGPRHFAQVSFSKWLTTYPNMAGFVGDDYVGEGAYAGEILTLTTTPDGRITRIEAMYHLNGSERNLTARVQVTQDNSAGVATITGVVTNGWLTGGTVQGEYKVITTCPQGTCFQGTLTIRSAKKD